MRLSLLVVFLSVCAKAQPAPEAGRVVGTLADAETGEPLIGASIWLPGTPLGAATDLWGRYELDAVPAGTRVFRAGYVGYEEGTVAVVVRPGTTTTAHVRLRPSGTLDCVIGCAERVDPLPGAYAARVVAYAGVEGPCCGPARWVRYDPPNVTLESR